MHNKNIYRRGTFWEQVLLHIITFFQSSYFFNKAASSEEVVFQKSCFIKRATFLERLLSIAAAFQKRYLFRRGTFSQLPFLSTVTLPIYHLLYLQKLLPTRLQRLFSTLPQCCLIFSWIKFQMLVRCCLIHTNHHTETLFVFTYLCPCLTRPRSIYVVSMWAIFRFHLHAHFD